jgi:hypothetical protein
MLMVEMAITSEADGLDYGVSQGMMRYCGTWKP